MDIFSFSDPTDPGRSADARSGQLQNDDHQDDDDQDTNDGADEASVHDYSLQFGGKAVRCHPGLLVLEDS